MVQAILVIHLLTALIIIGLIMMQQGKGAEAGASFGAGASQTIFGSAGSWNFFSRMTAIFATIFFITSIALAVIAKNSAVVEDPYLPAAERVEIPAANGGEEIPTANTAPEVPVSQEDLIPSPEAAVPSSGEAVQPAEAEVPAREAESAEQGESAAEQPEEAQ